MWLVLNLVQGHTDKYARTTTAPNFDSDLITSMLLTFALRLQHVRTLLFDAGTCMIANNTMPMKDYKTNHPVPTKLKRAFGHWAKPIAEYCSKHA